MRKATFSGITILNPDESVTLDNGAFIGRDRETVDRYLELGAKTHRHTGLDGLDDPVVAMGASAITSAGTISPDQTFALGYTLGDSNGGETLLSPIVSFSTPDPIAPPGVSLSGEAVYEAGGDLPIDTYYYAFSFIDKSGGETPVGPAVAVERQPGWSAAKIALSGFAGPVSSAGASGWRLYRAVGGGDFGYLTSGTANTFTDDGAALANCDIPPLPNGVNTTNSTSSFQIKLPSSAIVGEAETINVYMTNSNTFIGDVLLDNFPVSSAGKTVVYAEVDLLEGQPPDVSTSVGGAHQIDPDTELLDWHWKRPIASSAVLSSGDQGDVRMEISTGDLYGVLGSSATQAKDWSRISSGAAGEGKEGEPGAEGKEGRWSGVHYVYKTNTENTEPASGQLKFNAALSGSPTILRINETDADANALAALIATWDDSTTTNRARLVMRKIGSPTIFAVFTITGTLEDKGAYDNITVSKVLVSGSFSDGDAVTVEVFPTGDKGEKGEQGEKGSTGSTGATGAAGSAGARAVAAGNPGSATGTTFVEATRITGTSNGKIGVEGSLDGVTIALGDWVFVFTGNKNDGLYEVTQLGNVAEKWSLKRVSGFDTSAGVLHGTIFIAGGETYARRTFFATAATSFVLGTDEPKYQRAANWGVTTITDSGTNSDLSGTISHGLGRTPEMVQVVARTGAFQINTTWSTPTSTTFTAYGLRTDGANLGSVDIAWYAV
jgi:hypothetical protein